MAPSVLNPLTQSALMIVSCLMLAGPLYGRLESTKGTYAKEWAKWEKQMQELLFGNAEYSI